MDLDPRATGSAHGIPAPTHRLPADLRLGRVRLQVADLDRSLDYYGRVLGLRVVARSADGASLGPDGGDTVLVELHERPGAGPVPRRGRLGLFHFAILLPDRPSLGRLLAHLRERGEPTGASDHRVSEALYLTDPDGLGIEVYADRPPDSWRYQGREMLMATEPLDLEDLLAAAGSAPWTGMPAGTRMGHVHLHVGDLAVAEAFYHGALGLDKVVWSYPGALFLSAGGYHHHLGVNVWAGPGALPAAEAEARLLSWEMVVSLDAAERAVEALRRSGHEARPAGAGSWRISDPWGTELRWGPGDRRAPGAPAPGTPHGE